MQLSIAHRDALFNALTKNELDFDIPIDKFTELVTNLEMDLTCNMLYFQDNELPSEDVIEKNLVMYIQVKVDFIFVKKTLIDIGSNMNFYFVDLLQKKFSSMYENIKITTISIKGFDNTEKESIGCVCIPIEVGG